MLTDRSPYEDQEWQNHTLSVFPIVTKKIAASLRLRAIARGIIADPSRLPQKQVKRPSKPQQEPLRQLGLKLRPHNKAVISLYGPRSPKPATKQPIAPSEPATPLGLSSVANSRKPEPKERKPRGRKGITRHGQDMVKDMATLIERKYDRRQLSFGTATLPPLPPDDLHKIQSNFGPVVNRFMEEIGRELKRKGLEFVYLFVNEVQEKRWLKRGEVGLHVHWLMVGRSSPWAEWAISPKRVAEIWARVLARFLGYEPDTRKATRVEVPRKSVRKELGKYLSKGCQAVKEIVQSGQGDRLPSAWWGGQTSLKREVHASIVVFDQQVAKAVEERLEEWRAAGLCTYTHIYRQHEDREIWVAASINFKTDYEVVYSLLKVLEASFSSA